MNYKCTTACSLHLPPEEINKVRSTNEWYHVIRDYSRGFEKQWKEVVKNFKKMIEMGTLVKTKELVTQITIKSPKAPRAAASPKGTPKTQVPVMKAPKVAFKKIDYVVSDPNDNRHWDFKIETFPTVELRDKKEAEIRKDPNCSFVSRGWGDRVYRLTYWKVREE